MNEPRPLVSIGSMNVRGDGVRATGARVAQDVAAGIAAAAADATQPIQIDALRLTLPAGASRAEIAREIRRALDRAAGGGR